MTLEKLAQAAKAHMKEVENESINAAAKDGMEIGHSYRKGLLEILAIISDTRKCTEYIEKRTRR